MPIRVGTAPDSWGVWAAADPRQTPWPRFLDEVAEAGYDAIELGPFGYLPTAPQRIAEELGKRSLQLAGGTISVDLATPDGWAAARATAVAVCDILEHLGARFLVLLDAAPRGPAVDVATVHRLGEYTARRGIATVFHPHADATVQFEPEIERFLAETDSALVNLCLDVGHHAYAGGDPVRFLRVHHARIPYLHLKDVAPAVAERARTDGWTMARAVDEGAFVDLGQGAVEFDALNRVVAEVGYDGWGIVEQDMFPAPFDKPLPIARRNRQFLREHQIG